MPTSKAKERDKERKERKEQEKVRKEPSKGVRITDKEKGGLEIHRATGTTRAKQKDGTQERMKATEKEKEQHKAKANFP